MADAAGEIDVDTLADMPTTIFEGGFMMSKTLNEPGLIAEQLRHYRRYLELTFSPKPELQSA